MVCLMTNAQYIELIDAEILFLVMLEKKARNSMEFWFMRNMADVSGDFGKFAAETHTRIRQLEDEKRKSKRRSAKKSSA